jgi:hypothetical protein
LVPFLPPSGWAVLCFCAQPRFWIVKMAASWKARGKNYELGRTWIEIVIERCREAFVSANEMEEEYSQYMLRLGVKLATDIWFLSSENSRRSSPCS